MTEDSRVSLDVEGSSMNGGSTYRDYITYTRVHMNTMVAYCLYDLCFSPGARY